MSDGQPNAGAPRRRTLAALLLVALAASLGWRLWQRWQLGEEPVQQRQPSLESAQQPAAARNNDYLLRSANAMATRIDVTLPSGQVEAAATVFETFRHVDARMSEWKETSPLSAVNQAAGGAAVAVPADLRAVIHRGVELSRLTEGAFDLTWAALWGLWDFSAKAPRVPDRAEIARRVALVDYRQLELDEAAGTVRLRRPGMKLGLGGIAKGHALDTAADQLRRAGLRSFMISAGGQVLVAGRRGDRPWRVGIRDPRGGRGDYLVVLELVDTSISTSGDYEHYFERDGVRYHHILDPRSGMPARGLRSATVISRDATLADALSTALMILGRDRALALVERQDDAEAVLVDDQGGLHTSSGASRLLSK